MLKREDLPNLFMYHPQLPGQGDRYAQLRAKALEWAELLFDLAPESAERTIAVREMQSAMMWGNGSIAINEKGEQNANPG